MERHKKLRIKGNIYSNFKEAYADKELNIHNISYSTVMYRVKTGVELDSIFDIKPQKYKMNIRGKLYNSLVEACKDTELNKYNLSYKTVQRRKSHLVANDDLFNLDEKRVRIAFKGKMYAGLTDLCKDTEVNVHGLNYKTIYSRLSKGISIEDAISKPLGKIRVKGKGVYNEQKSYYKW